MEDPTTTATEDALSVRERQRLVRVLQALARMARDRSLTGELSEGHAMAIRQYNAVLQRAEQVGAIPVSLFPPLDSTADFDSAGVAATGLAEYLREEDEPTGKRRFHLGGGVFEASPHHVKIVGFPGDIGDLSRMLREYLPEFLRARGEPTPPPPPPPPPGTGEEAGARRTFMFHSHGAESGASQGPGEEHLESNSAAGERGPGRPASHGSLHTLEQRIAELSGRMARPGIPPEELAALGREIGELARRWAEQAARRGHREHHHPWEL